MEQRRVYGKKTTGITRPSQPIARSRFFLWSRRPLTLMTVFLLDLPLAADLSHPHEGWLAPARQLTKVLFPGQRHGNPITNLQRLRPS